jgi:hypothetical protein
MYYTTYTYLYSYIHIYIYRDVTGIKNNSLILITKAVSSLISAAWSKPMNKDCRRSIALEKYKILSVRISWGGWLSMHDPSSVLSSQMPNMLSRLETFRALMSRRCIHARAGILFKITSTSSEIAGISQPDEPSTAVLLKLTSSLPFLSLFLSSSS